MEIYKRQQMTNLSPVSLVRYPGDGDLFSAHAPSAGDSQAGGFEEESESKSVFTIVLISVISKK